MPMGARTHPTCRQAAAVPELAAALLLALLLPSAAAQGSVCNQVTHIVASTPGQCGTYCLQGVPAGIMARPQTYTGPTGALCCTCNYDTAPSPPPSPPPAPPSPPPPPSPSPPLPPPGKVCGNTAHPLVADEAECLAECRAQARIQGPGTTIAPQTYPATTESLANPGGTLCCKCNFKAPVDVTDDGTDDGEAEDTPAPRPQQTGAAAGCKAADFVVGAAAGCELQCDLRLPQQPAGTYKRPQTYAGTAGKLCCGCNFAKAAVKSPPPPPPPSPPPVLPPEPIRAPLASPPPPVVVVASPPPPVVVVPTVVDAAGVEDAAATEEAAAPEPAEGGCRQGWHPLVGSDRECTWTCKRRLQGKEEGTTIDPEAYPGTIGGLCCDCRYGREEAAGDKGKEETEADRKAAEEAAAKAAKPQLLKAVLGLGDVSYPMAARKQRMVLRVLQNITGTRWTYRTEQYSTPNSLPLVTVNASASADEAAAAAAEGGDKTATRRLLMGAAASRHRRGLQQEEAAGAAADSSASGECGNASHDVVRSMAACEASCKLKTLELDGSPKKGVTIAPETYGGPAGKLCCKCNFKRDESVAAGGDNADTWWLEGTPVTIVPANSNGIYFFADVEMPGDEVDAAVQSLYTASDDDTLTEQVAAAGLANSGSVVLFAGTGTPSFNNSNVVPGWASGSSGGGGTSTAVIVGVSVGVGVALLLAAGIAFFFVRRSRKKAAADAHRLTQRWASERKFSESGRMTQSPSSKSLSGNPPVAANQPAPPPPPRQPLYSSIPSSITTEPAEQAGVVGRMRRALGLRGGD